MIEKAIQKILDISRPTHVVIEGLQYIVQPGGLKLLEPPVPETLEVTTLQAVIDYLKENPDSLQMKEIIVQVVSPTEVRVHETLVEEYLTRGLYVVAKAIRPERYNWGQFVPLEEFIVGLQTQFVESDTVRDLLKLLGNLTDENVRLYSDDGITQGVTARVGLVKAANVPVPSPVELAPYWSFPDVEQVTARFIFRMRAGDAGKQPTCALLLVDGEKAKVAAIRKVAQHLKEKLPDGIVMLS